MTADIKSPNKASKIYEGSALVSLISLGNPDLKSITSILLCCNAETKCSLLNYRQCFGFVLIFMQIFQHFLFSVKGMILKNHKNVGVEFN